MSGDDERAGELPLAYPGVDRVDVMAPLTIGNVALLSIRLLGVYCLLQAVPLLYMVPGMALVAGRLASSELLSYAIVGLSPALYLAIAVLLLSRSAAIARWVSGAGPIGSATDGVVSAAPGRATQALAFAIVGVVLFVHAASEIAGVFAGGYRESRLTGRDVPTSVLDDSLPELLPAALRAGAGMWLFFGSKRLASYWRRIRMADDDPRPTGLGEPAGGARAPADDAV